jgi:hypothetical protein
VEDRIKLAKIKFSNNSALEQVHLQLRTGKAKQDEAIAAQLAQRGYSKELLPF